VSELGWASSSTSAGQHARNPAGRCSLAVDARFIYWINYNGNALGRANLDGTNVRQNFITNLDSQHACGVAVSSP
jgi:hypothetical protein